MPDFTILLPPAEGKREGGNPFAPDMFDYRSSNTFNYFSELNPDRRRLIDALQAAVKDDGTDLGALLGVTGEHLEKAVAADRAIYDAPLMSALDRYSPGVLYQSMDFAGLPTGAQRRLLENGIIFSGLFGLLRPDDLIPNYRLSIHANVPEIGKVAHYWRPQLSAVLNRTVDDRFVWNLLPNAHRDAWDDAHTYRQMVDVRFFKETGGERKAVSHGVKTLRGQLVNFIVRETVESLEPLLEWEHPEGYRYDPDASTTGEEKRHTTVVMVQEEGG